MPNGAAVGEGLGARASADYLANAMDALRTSIDRRMPAG
jgi:hypothetical protein